MPQKKWSNNSNYLLLLALFGFVLFFNLGEAPVYILDEVRNAQCAWEMLQGNNYIVPSFNDTLRAEKPPLHYYFIMIAYTLLGKTAFAARLFSALCGIVTLLVTYLFTRKCFNERLAVTSMVILGISAHFLFEFRLSVPDPYLILFQTLTLFCLYAFSLRQRVVWLYAAGFFAAVSTLAKGPVAVVLPALIFIVFLATAKQLKLLLNRHWIICFAGYLLIATPWFIQVHQATAGEFTRIFFLKNNIGRFSAPMEGHKNFLGLPLLIVIAGLLPASALLFTNPTFYKSLWQNLFCRFSVIVCGATLLFYSFSGTLLPNYPMICYPFAAIVAGYIFLQIRIQRIYPFLYSLSGVYLLLGIAAFFALRSESSLDKNTPYWSLVFIIPLIAIFITGRWMKRRQKHAFVFFVTGFSVFNCVALGMAYPYVYRQNPVTSNLQLINKPEAVLGSFGMYNSAVNFYIKGFVQPLSDSAEILSFLEKHESAVLTGRKKDAGKLNNLPVEMIAEQKDLFENPTTVFFKRSDSLLYQASQDSLRPR